MINESKKGSQLRYDAWSKSVLTLRKWIPNILYHITNAHSWKLIASVDYVWLMLDMVPKIDHHRCGRHCRSFLGIEVKTRGFNPFHPLLIRVRATRSYTVTCVLTDPPPMTGRGRFFSSHRLSLFLPFLCFAGFQLHSL